MTQSEGVFQREDKTWGFEFSIVVNGKRIGRKRVLDDEGQPFTTKKAAQKARARCMLDTRNKILYPTIQTEKSTLITFRDVYEEYRKKGCSGKAYNTVRKQDSIWNNHLNHQFGDRFIDSFTVIEVNDYLAHLYYDEDRAYRYVEAFLKMFYLIFGQAYGRNYISSEYYNRLCVNKSCRFKMPKKKTDEEDDDIAVFSQEQIDYLDCYFSKSNAETAYYLGKYCGLRINECYGLKWSNVNLNEGTILIDRQEQYQNGLIKLVALKTRNAKRTIYMCDALKCFFQKLAEQRKEYEIKYAALRQQNQTIITDIDGSPLSSLELVNSLPDGKIQTVNSMKYHSRTLKEKGIPFKYHYLRHTYGTRMAELNTPHHLLCKQMGHGKIDTTMKYYLGKTKSGIDILLNNLNQI